jgi:hypothetical protein
MSITGMLASYILYDISYVYHLGHSGATSGYHCWLNSMKYEYHSEFYVMSFAYHRMSYSYHGGFMPWGMSTPMPLDCMVSLLFINMYFTCAYICGLNDMSCAHHSGFDSML